jgi:hypothetical protein
MTPLPPPSFFFSSHWSLPLPFPRALFRYTVPSTAVEGFMRMDGTALASVVTEVLGPQLLASLPPLEQCVGPRGGIACLLCDLQLLERFEKKGKRMGGGDSAICPFFT